MEKALSFNDLVFPPKRESKTNKYDYGSLLIVGGSPGMMGAPQLAAKAAFRVGTGLVSVAIRKSEMAYFTQLFPEEIILFYDEISNSELLKNKTAILFGPGIKETDGVSKTLFHQLFSANIPMIVDAGGLAFLKYELTNYRNIHPPLIITPHLGEARRFFGTDEVISEAQKIVDDHFFVIIKNYETTLISPEEIRIASLGNPGMATAGSGDVLAGMIAGLVAQGFPLLRAMVSGVIWHQKAGDLAFKKLGEAAMMASDIIDEIASVYQNRSY